MFDILIKNANIIDGTGKEGYVGDIAIKDGKIAKIGVINESASEIIDATGLTLTPGFIDSHSHSDNAIFDAPEMLEKIEQGITTAVSGQCGSSAAPKLINENNDALIEGVGKLSEAVSTFGNFMKSTQDYTIGANNICLIGHATIRRAVMGMKQEAPTPDEMERMKAYIKDAMESGAIGMSLGLIYPPSSYAKTEELCELAKVVGEYGGIIAAHIRNEADRLIESVEEFIQIIRSSGTRGVISHHKASGGKRNHGKVNKTLAMIDKANAEGLDIYVDVYPYIASHTSASVTFVPDSGRDLIARLENAEEREKIRESHKTRWWNGDYSWVFIAKCTAYPEYEGLYLPSAAKLHGKDEIDTILDMIHDSKNNCSCCYFTMCEEDVETVMCHPRSMIGTDSSVSKGRTVFHPRLKGTFPRVLGRYVREKGVVTLPEMIRKMTSLPASVYGLSTKGLIAKGMDADICIFDADKIIDRSEYSDCNKRAEGLSYVILGGKIVVKDAVFNGVMNGSILR